MQLSIYYKNSQAESEAESEAIHVALTEKFLLSKLENQAEQSEQDLKEHIQQILELQPKAIQNGLEQTQVEIAKNLKLFESQLQAQQARKTDIQALQSKLLQENQQKFMKTCSDDDDDKSFAIIKIVHFDENNNIKTISKLEIYDTTYCKTYNDSRGMNVCFNNMNGNVTVNLQDYQFEMSSHNIGGDCSSEFKTTYYLTDNEKNQFTNELNKFFT